MKKRTYFDKAMAGEYECQRDENNQFKPPIVGRFTIVDSCIGSGGGVVFVLKHNVDGKQYEVAFKDIKPFLNGTILGGRVVAGKYSYNWGFDQKFHE